MAGQHRVNICCLDCVLGLSLIVALVVRFGSSWSSTKIISIQSSCAGEPPYRQTTVLYLKEDVVLHGNLVPFGQIKCVFIEILRTILL